MRTLVTGSIFKKELCASHLCKCGQKLVVVKRNETTHAIVGLCPKCGKPVKHIW